MTQLRAPKVIVIDDDPAVRSVIVAAFNRVGCETRWAVDGRSGVRLFNAEPAHLVVTDIVMPNQEGIETIMQQTRRERPPRVIAISGGGRRGGQDFLVWASHLGADATLPKPFRTSQLIEVARALLERRTPPAESSPFAREDGFGRERFQSERAA
ncbi:MAG: response regulator [Phenylobacterium sp.]